MADIRSIAGECSYDYNSYFVDADSRVVIQMEYKEILSIAGKYQAMLEPYCKRIEIAGSIRRKKPESRDIEIVCVVDPERIDKFESVVNYWLKCKGSPRGRYTQRMTPSGLKLDLFMCELDNWGNIFLIRTGNWKFSRFMMGIRAKQVGYLHRYGYLWHEGNKFACYEERDVFRLLKMDWIKPEDREWD